MSILKVDTINEKTSGNGVQITGHVIQTANNTSPPTAIETVNNNDTWVATGVHTSITPKSTTSKMLIVCDVHIDSATGTNCSLGIFKDGTILTPRSAGTGGSTYDGHAYFNRLNEGRLLLQQTVMASDASVGTTNSVTYKLYLKTHSGLIYLRHDLMCPRIFIWELAA